nr:hypothetical protein [Tanacetum cinerariifolium]
DCDFEEDIRLIEKLLYDNSSPHPLEDFVSVNSDAKSESFSPSPILVKDSDSLVEEIDLFYTLDYPMPTGIMDKDYESERDILIRKDLPSNNTLSFAEKESFHFDIPPFSRPSAKPPDGERIPRKGQNRIKIGQKREAWRSREKSEAVTMDKGRKTKEDTKKRARNANHTSFKRRKKRTRAAFAIS